MSNEEKTRIEVINSLMASNAALLLLLQERVAELPEFERQEREIVRQELGPPLTSEHEMHPGAKEALAEQKAKRVKKAVAGTALGQRAAHVPQLPIPTVGEYMANIKPVKPGKTLADLRVALQACITAHGMTAAKERLVPYAKVSDVPDEAIANVIKALAA